MSALVAAMAVWTAVLAFSSPAQASAAGEYVALGDSYASGVGAPPYDPASGTCLRSPAGYPRSWAAMHPQSTIKDVTCSGATVADVRKNQLDALSTATTLVTITVGGNDDGFTSTVQNCLVGSDGMCQWSTQIGAYYATHQLVDELDGLYAEVKRRAPNANVIALGYPRAVSTTGSCGLLPLEAARRAALNANADALAEGTQAAAERQGVYFIDVRPIFDGHEACGPAPWINAVDAAHLTETFHPTATGYGSAYAAVLTLVTDWRWAGQAG